MRGVSFVTLNLTWQLYITETHWPPGYPVGPATLRAKIKETPSTTRSNYTPFYCLVVVTHVKKKLRVVLVCLELGCVGKGGGEDGDANCDIKD